MTGLGKNTISLIAEELIREKVIYEAYTENRKQAGRPMVALDICPEALPVLGIVMSSGRITGTVFNYGLEPVHRYEREGLKSEELLSNLLEMTEQVLRDIPGLFGISVAVPGIVNPEKGIVEKSYQLCWEKLKLKREIQNLFGGRVFLCNTVKSVALLQYEEALNKPESVFLMNIDRGLGGAYIHRNSVLYGTNGAACEIGQMRLSLTGEETIETYYNRIMRKAKNLLEMRIEELDQVAELILMVIQNLNFLFDPEKMFLYGAAVNDKRLKQILTEKGLPPNTSFSGPLDNNLAAAYALLNAFENESDY